MFNYIDEYCTHIVYTLMALWVYTYIEHINKHIDVREFHINKHACSEAHMQNHESMSIVYAYKILRVILGSK